MTAGLLVSAHRAQGQPPWEGGMPPGSGGWVRCGSFASLSRNNKSVKIYDF